MSRKPLQFLSPEQDGGCSGLYFHLPHEQDFKYISKRFCNWLMYWDTTSYGRKAGKDNGKATYEQVKIYVLEQTGLKVSSRYIAQVKRKCGLEGWKEFQFA